MSKHSQTEFTRWPKHKRISVIEESRILLIRWTAYMLVVYSSLAGTSSLI